MSDRYISHFPKPDGLPRELLEILAEECAEVVQRVTKALRFGLDESQPGQPFTNAARIGHEVGDVLATLERLQDINVLRRADVAHGVESKRRQLLIFLQNEPVTERV
ncbi:hypothetical protein GJ654_10260 [Rhodoblastus acidophilus]|uniref:Uncharacterized protein n=1 Tax=Rhodoblastus acidophilus TaxID=1074 RepID=A0A6N8DNE5_RHOAC|nr:MazG nucleotide pyrophosphohydrolase domain-containing protein [Rhodoblastus acidophilus]MCW2275106.1 hypothetical protein [Rhodoblastus acidophilus]MTV31376.1 hypothetical protein [Rhodoblastus acidophilus]